MRVGNRRVGNWIVVALQDSANNTDPDTGYTRTYRINGDEAENARKMPYTRMIPSYNPFKTNEK